MCSIPQTLVLALEMSVDVEDYVSNPNNVQLIQDALKKKISKKNTPKKNHRRPFLFDMRTSDRIKWKEEKVIIKNIAITW